MTRLNWRTVAAAAIGASSIFVSAGAQAHDDERWQHERWERERYEHRHPHYEPPAHWHRYAEAPVVYERRPPVVVMPAPVYQAPAYSPPMDPSLNFNFTIPLR